MPSPGLRSTEALGSPLVEPLENLHLGAHEFMTVTFLESVLLATSEPRIWSTRVFSLAPLVFSKPLLSQYLRTGPFCFTTFDT